MLPAEVPGAPCSQVGWSSSDFKGTGILLSCKNFRSLEQRVYVGGSWQLPDQALGTLPRKLWPESCHLSQLLQLPGALYSSFRAASMKPVRALASGRKQQQDCTQEQSMGSHPGSCLAWPSEPITSQTYLCGTASDTPAATEPTPKEEGHNIDSVSRTVWKKLHSFGKIVRSNGPPHIDHPLPVSPRSIMPSTMLSSEGGQPHYLCCDNRCGSHTDNSPNTELSLQSSAHRLLTARIRTASLQCPGGRWTLYRGQRSPQL